MHRIASALLIVAAVLALNAGMVREAFPAPCRAPAGPAPDAPGRAELPRGIRVLGLVVALEGLRQVPPAGTGQKV